MDSSILKTDTYIDAYLAGTLTQEDRQAFEQQLQTDKELQMKLALHREIVTAIREKRMRELTKQFETNDHRHKQWQRIAKWTAATFSLIAIAACLFGFIVHLPQVNNIERINAESPVFVQATQEITLAYSDLKGCEDVAESLLTISLLMQQGEYAQADALLANELKQHKDVTKEQAQAWAEKEDMLYLQALCSIQQKQVYRSRALLTQVITMHGIHEQQAQELLDQIKHGK